MKKLIYSADELDEYVAKRINEIVLPYKLWTFILAMLVLFIFIPYYLTH